MASNDALLRQVKLLDKLYDAESMMMMTQAVAKGYVVLLACLEQGQMPNSSSNKKNKSQKDVSLAFMALVQGNVLDTCFGIRGNSASSRQRGDETPATRAVREAKQMLEDCASTDSFRVCAVDAYCEAFRAIVTYRTKYEKLNCITRCFKAKKLQVVCEKQLRQAFESLAKAIAEQL